MEQQPTLVIYDYDHSLINVNSDTHVVEVLAPDLMPNFKIYRQEDGVGWTETMDRQMCHLWARGIKPNDILQCVGSVPMQEGMEEALKLAAGQPGCEVCIVSDANTVFIQAMLDQQGLGPPIVSRVVSNPAYFTGEGCLRVTPHHQMAPFQETYEGRPAGLEAEQPSGDGGSSGDWFVPGDYVGAAGDLRPHGCSLCTDNICKGSVLDGLLQEAKAKGTEFGRIIYVGDGGGDFCPCTKLRETDIVMARVKEDGKPFALLDKIEKSRQGLHDNSVQAVVYTWSTGIEFLDHFKSIFGKK
eukprot:CAMPEP_0113945050 /NCGR_PEP_ID=MMETSP1339-20121228/38455_1 /TAXON_ID=94617 /ORGANISM="Fibrocapsa japonica" /LENGTH=298 /DNA_ID=CAMNT_0000950447 /DNA_START=26 /DNA_END=922 /DNA_ORIENTATION=+ /assembly_acc=CAM_ASM_000762